MPVSCTLRNPEAAAEEKSFKKIATEEHWGNPDLVEMLPFMLDCLDQGYTQVEVMNSVKRTESAHVNENMIVSTSGAFAPETPHCAIEALSVDRVMIATDYPFVSTQDAVRSVEAASLTMGKRRRSTGKMQRSRWESINQSKNRSGGRPCLL